MSLLKVAGMTYEQRDHRREMDEACFHRVHTEIERGVQRSASFTQVARALKIKREDVIAGYWRHVRRNGFG